MKVISKEFIFTERGEKRTGYCGMISYFSNKENCYRHDRIVNVKQDWKKYKEDLMSLINKVLDNEYSK